MDQLGYNVQNASVSGGESIIKAYNCVFHSLVKKDLAICNLQFVI
jgi:predicted ArsR family transcriptional regulator